MAQLALKDYDETTQGIPKFWLHTLKNANDEALMETVQPQDEEILAHLTDIADTFLGREFGAQFLTNFVNQSVLFP